MFVAQRTITKCKECGIEFNQTRSDQEFCSKKCYLKVWQRENRKPIVLTERKCQRCTVIFIPTANAQIHCSPECRYQKRLFTLRNGKTSAWSKGKEYVPREKCIVCAEPFYCAPCVKRRSQNTGSFCSQSCRGRYISQHPEMFPKHSIGRYGYRPDMPKSFFRSAWEANWARYLDLLKSQKIVKKWEHEPRAFDVNIEGGIRGYLPDFRVTYTNGLVEYHEVKGYMDQRSINKISGFKIGYPELILKVIDSRVYRQVEKIISNQIMFWEKS